MQRYFDHHSLLREVVGHRLTALSGPRALLLMAAHPLAFAGFFAHTGALADPYGRLRRTARVMDAVAFGTAAQAERMTAPVRGMHSRVRGELAFDAGRFPAGTPYRGDDPELLLWILAALAESAMLVFPRWVRPLSREELNELWQDYRQVGRWFGDPQPADNVNINILVEQWQADALAQHCDQHQQPVHIEAVGGTARLGAGGVGRERLHLD